MTSRSGPGELMMDDLVAFLREVSKIPSLPPFQQRCLFQETEQSGPQADLARARLVEVNLRLAVSVARKYQGRGLPIGRLIEASTLGLIRAVDKFNFRSNSVEFPKYAIWWMRKSIVVELEKNTQNGRE